MATLTLFFNSDSDINLSNTELTHGLDRIPIGPRAHLLSKLSIGNASFLNRTASELLKTDNQKVHPHHLRLTNCMSINGPGSGYFLSDNRFTDPSYSLKLTDGQFSTYWKRNARRALEILLLGLPYQQQETFFEETIALEEYPKDWLLNEFRIMSNTFLKAEQTDTSAVETINLIGWGRGAVSCHMLANHLSNSLASIPVNILAIDPIIGSNVHPEPRHTTLGANVQEYVGFYARDERSASLPCIVPNTDPNTRVHIYPIAGRHTTLIGNQAADGESRPGTLSEPADLIFYLAKKCLSRWDPTLTFPTADSDDYPDLSDNGNQVLTKIKSEYDNYVNMRNTTYSNQQQEVNGEREILLEGQLTNFKAAKGVRFAPSQGLAKGHIDDMSYFQDIL